MEITFLDCGMLHGFSPRAPNCILIAVGSRNCRNEKAQIAVRFFSYCLSVNSLFFTLRSLCSVHSVSICGTRLATINALRSGLRDRLTMRQGKIDGPLGRHRQCSLLRRLGLPQTQLFRRESALSRSFVMADFVEKITHADHALLVSRDLTIAENLRHKRTISSSRSEGLLPRRSRASGDYTQGPSRASGSNKTARQCTHGAGRV